MKKNIRRLPPLHPFLLLFETMMMMMIVMATGCAATGDWNEDSLFFSPRLGSERLAAMRDEVDRIDAETASSRRETAGLESRLQRAISSREGVKGEHQKLRHEIDKLESDLNDRRRELGRLYTENTELADKAHLIQTEIAVMQARLARLRKQLELAMRTR